MKYITGETNLQMQNKTAITLGKFEGLHRGHQKLFHKVLEEKANGYQTIVFTFSTPPMLLFTGRQQSSIHTNDERKMFLERAGIDYLIEYPFTSEVSHMLPEEFIKEVLIKRLHAACIVVGEDFHFGYQRAGDCKLLQKLSDQYGFRLVVLEKEKYGNRSISSSFIKEELAKGDLEKANELLGYPFTIYGKTQKGHQIGRTIGLPTINLLPAKEKLLPPNGVYISNTRIRGELYQGITNIGNKPTIDRCEPKGVETYLFDWEGDLYDEYVEVMLLYYKRAEKKFDSLRELKNQIDKDVEYGKKYFEQWCLQAAECKSK